MIDTAFLFARDLAFVAALYVLGACLCRLRLPDIAVRWVSLYTAVFASAAWYLYALIYEAVNGRDVLTICMVAAYIFFTQPSWANGVAEVARRAA